jgi:glutamate dehydrogenase/leucine dehydrogenase
MIELISKEGGILVGTSDSSGALYHESGLDISQIIRLKQEKKSLKEYQGALFITNMDLLEKPTDILVPAALENQITDENAHRIQAKIILELANGPVTPQADEILFSRGIPVIPDILANAGGVTVSYFEQVQNSMNYYWTKEEVQQKLQPKMIHALEGVMRSAKKHNVMLRTGAYIVAIERILEAMKVRTLS